MSSSSRVSSTKPGAGASIGLELTGRVMELLKAVGEFAPALPLKAICCVALVIIDTVKTLRKLKGDNQGLASRAAELAIAISTECCANENLTLEQQHKCDQLLETLQEIQAFMKAQLDVGRFKRYLKLAEFQEGLATYNQKLDDCSRLFSLTSILEIQRLISSESIINRSTLITLTSNINSSIEQVGRNIETSHREVRTGLDNLATRFDLVIASSATGVADIVSDEGCRILRQDQVNLGRSLRTLPNAFIYRGNFRSEQGPTKALIKMYSPTKKGRKEFKAGLEFWKKNFHPNLHQLLGHSTMSTPGPFLLLSDYASHDVTGHMRKQLESGEVMSFVSTARLLHGVASGMEYLRRHCSLTKMELQGCMEATNLVLTSEGEVVVGHNLLMSDPGLVSEPLPENLEEFLMEMFWFFGVRFTYGPNDPDLSDWDWISARNGGRSYSHMRMLECFMMFIAGALEDVAGELDNLIDSLESLAARGELTFKNIRNAVLQVRDGGIGFWYRPPKPLHCRLMDIGYMRNGEFIVLENCSDLDPFNNPTAVYRCEKSRDIDWVDEFGIRHCFTRSTSATIKCLTSCERIQDLNAAWTVLMENAERICEENKGDHLLDIGDLVLVTKIDTDMRIANYSWKAADDAAATPPSVEFIEHKTPDADRPWGYWVVNDDCGVTITENRCPQSIGFIQLDACDTVPVVADTL
ncbi:hypothetical protein B0H34DRAFT_798558 [Crassisporium funariophilum]|nr:hypothetical protein B0H34DRAFT_798558 [Crassisporium funariophilum]